MQVAAVAGIWGITFLVAWFASAFELAWRNGFAWSAGFEPLVVFTAVASIVVLAGAVRVARAPTNHPSTMRVATINRLLDLFAPAEMTRIAEGQVSGDSTLVAQLPIGHVPDAVSARRRPVRGAVHGRPRVDVDHGRFGPGDTARPRASGRARSHDRFARGTHAMIESTRNWHGILAVIAPLRSGDDYAIEEFAPCVRFHPLLHRCRNLLTKQFKRSSYHGHWGVIDAGHNPQLPAEGYTQSRRLVGRRRKKP